jgi:hypothetical protein
MAHTKGVKTVRQQHRDSLDGYIPSKPPATPTISSPVYGAAGVSRSVPLTSIGFSSGTDTHAYSQWQLSLLINFSSIAFDSGAVAAPNLTSYTVPATSTAYSTAYFARCRHKGTATGWSEWSAASLFTVVNPTVQAFVTPGQYTFTVPANITNIKQIYCVGAGGNGGADSGQAGNGGALRYGVDVAVTPGQVINLQVGQQGQSSYFGSVVAFGGQTGSTTSSGTGGTAGSVGGSGAAGGGGAGSMSGPGGNGAAGAVGSGGGGVGFSFNAAATLLAMGLAAGGAAGYSAPGGAGSTNGGSGGAAGAFGSGSGSGAGGTDGTNGGAGMPATGVTVGGAGAGGSFGGEHGGGGGGGGFGGGGGSGGGGNDGGNYAQGGIGGSGCIVIVY